jgi:hypothetical protein
MNDLLYSVKGADGGAAASGSGRPVFDVEAGYTAAAGAAAAATPSADKSKDMEEFFLRVDEVKRSIAEIKAKHREIQRMHEQSKTIIRKNEIQQHRSDMQVCVCVCLWREGGERGVGCAAAVVLSRSASCLARRQWCVCVCVCVSV